ncbi:hypothetical protein WG622_11435 [Cognatishimia sp. D5M38]|uniref:Uncharacterized protein n=1 Tax=Cognatishimia coralii TaxID=3083254 RepID=A0ABU8QHG1_9RHOB
MVRVLRTQRALAKKMSKGALSNEQQDELNELSYQLSEIRERLVEMGADPKKLFDETTIDKSLKRSNGRMHMSLGQSGGVGVRGLPQKRKLWKKR